MTQSHASADVCVPCQVIIWDNQMVAMLTSVNTLAQIDLAGGKKLPAGWGAKFYERVAAACAELQPLMTELTGVS